MYRSYNDIAKIGFFIVHLTHRYNPRLYLDVITLNPYMALPLFTTRFAGYAGGIRVSFIQPRLF